VSAIVVARAFNDAGRTESAHRLWHEGRRAAARLGRERIAWSKPLALLAHAAIDLSQGRIEHGRQGLQTCACIFDHLGMRLYAAAARARLGRLVKGDEGVGLLDAARVELESEGVTNVERMLNLLSPGFG
jgi:hypothetical protein